MSSFNIYIVVYAFLVEVKWITFSFFFYLKNFSLLPSFFPAFIALIPFWVDTKATSGAVLWKKLFLETSQHWQENACVDAFIKRDSSTIFFLWLLQNLKEHLFLRTSANGSFCRQFYRSSHRRSSVRKGVLRDFAKFTGNTCPRVSFLIKLHAQGWNFIKKEVLKQVFSCELCEISKSTFFTEHLQAIASRFTTFYI